MPEGGKVSLPVVPDFAGFGSLFNSGIRGALNQAQSLGKQAGGLLGGGLKAGLTLGLAGAAIGIADFVGHSIKDFGRLADQTRSLQRLTGASAESASLFASTIAHMGVDVDGASRGLGIFGAHIAAQPELFAKYHVAIAKTASGNNDLLGTLDNLRKAFNGTSDASTRDAAAKALLGRSYQTLLPYLTATDDRLALFQRLARNSGQVLSQADVDKARELKIQVQELTDQVEHLKVSAGRQGAGFLSNFLTGASIVSKTGIGDIARVLGATLTGQASLLPQHIRQAVLEEQGLSRAAAEAEISFQEQALASEKVGTALKGVSGAAEGLRSAQEGVHSAEEALASASRGVVTARRGVETAHENAAKAAKDLTKAEADLAKLEAAGPVDAKAVEEARRGLDSANRSVRDSTEALAAAEQHLAEVQQGASADDLANAQLRLRSADIALKEARLAQSQPGSATDPYAGAQAKLNVDQAVEARKEAAENLLTVQQKGTAQDKEVVAAQTAVRDATERVTDATTAQTDAQQKLAEAQAGDPDFLQKVADAKDRVADATRGVRDAQQGEADAAQAVRDAQQQVADASTALQDATYKARDAQYALDEQWQKAIDSGTDLGRVLDELKDKYPELTGLVRQYNDEYARGQGSGGAFAGQSVGVFAFPEAAPSQFKYTPVPQADINRAFPPGLPPSLPPKGRASGGDVVPGQMYRVNENTTNSELVQFSQPGHVFTPAQAAAAMPSDATQPLVLNVYLQDGSFLAKVDTGLRARRKAYSR